MIDKKNVLIILFILGTILLIVNIYGFFIPLKNPAIYNEQKTGFANDTILSSRDTFALLENIDKKNTKEYVIVANDIFNKSIAHYWEDEGLMKYNLTIPIYKNYILYSLSFIYPSIYKKYEFCEYKKTIKRGVGLCSQHAIAITDFLNKEGIETRVVGLDGHVVAMVKVDEEKNEWWIVDPDFGVAMPYNINYIETFPDIIKTYYENKLPKNNNVTANKMARIYGRKGNILYPIGTNGYIDCNWKKIIIERISYFLKWLIPALLMLPFLSTFFKQSNSSENKKCKQCKGI